MAEKSRTVQDESYRDLTNLERKLQKHEAFELELRANEGQLRSINKVTIQLIYFLQFIDEKKSICSWLIVIILLLLGWTDWTEHVEQESL
jgi:hypothetical protein